MKNKKIEEGVPKRKRGRPRKEESVAVVAPKKRGRPRKVDVVETAAVPKKRGRPRKVQETKEDKLRKVAKLGKRKFKAAVEQMALEKINRKIRRKNGNGNGESYGETVSVKTYSYASQSEISASPTKPPVGIAGIEKKKPKVVEEEAPLPIIDRVKKRLHDRGYDWNESSFKVIEESPTSLVVEFKDKKQGEVTSYNSILQHKKDQEIEERMTKAKKMPKLSKVELNRYIKKLKVRGLNPVNIKVLENTDVYFRIEFNDGKEGPLTTCGHVKSWEV